MGPATGKARPPTVDSFTDDTSRRLVRAERRERHIAYCSHIAFVEFLFVEFIHLFVLGYQICDGEIKLYIYTP